ncbi:hypothetical protein CAC42_1242 [Sphaceloma murrayae]|uniref:Uncharacterized protein n=1 Tax=Sphaceloma murrayae TaxID=2082308 RepID=A0A2K1R2P8_9PEZI|nr:hypothetical protein CAC42_1242 [Sphaceloma murrayae]
MSTASEQKAWGRNRPASISRAPAAQSRSSATSPSASGSTTPSPAVPRHTESKPLATVKPADQVATTPAPAPAGNIWAQRRAAQDQARVSGANTKETAAPANAETSKKSESVGSAGATPAKDAGYTPVCGFNVNEVKEFLKRDASSFKTYRVAESNPKPASAATRGNMANGQSFFSSLGKQVAQLQSSK